MTEEAKKTVVFNNTRIERGAPRPWSVRSYRNSKGTEVEFSKIPIYNEDGSPNMRENEQGNMVPVLYGKELNFTSQRSLRLDTVVHKDVIQAVRDWPGCVSSKKSDGVMPVKSGKLVENEPEVAEAKEYNELLSKTQAGELLSRILKETSKKNFDLICASLGIMVVNRQKKEVALMNLAFNTPDKLIEVFEDPEKGELKSYQINVAILKLASENNIIKQIAGSYIFNDEVLGSNLAEIISKKPEIIAKLNAALDIVVYGAAREERANFEKSALVGKGEHSDDEEIDLTDVGSKGEDNPDDDAIEELEKLEEISQTDKLAEELEKSDKLAPKKTTPANAVRNTRKK